MKRLIGLLLLFFILLRPDATFAQKDSEGQLDNCKEHSYCETDKTTWVVKSGCRIAKQFEEECKPENLENPLRDCKSSGEKYCICNYKRAPNSCGNRGGIKDASSNSFEGVFGRVETPKEIGAVGTGEGAISTLLQRVIQLLYTIGGIAFVFFFIWNALQLIISGGDKEKVAGARKHITWSIIGITLMALAFPIMKVIESIIGIKFFF